MKTAEMAVEKEDAHSCLSHKLFKTCGTCADGSAQFWRGVGAKTHTFGRSDLVMYVEYNNIHTSCHWIKYFKFDNIVFLSTIHSSYAMDIYGGYGFRSVFLLSFFSLQNFHASIHYKTGTQGVKINLPSMATDSHTFLCRYTLQDRHTQC